MGRHFYFVIVNRLRDIPRPPGLLLHGAFYVSLGVLTYTTTMWTLYFAFLEPRSLDELLRALIGQPSPKQAKPGSVNEQPQETES